MSGNDAKEDEVRWCGHATSAGRRRAPAGTGTVNQNQKMKRPQAFQVPSRSAQNCNISGANPEPAWTQPARAGRRSCCANVTRDRQPDSSRPGASTDDTVIDQVFIAQFAGARTGCAQGSSQPSGRRKSAPPHPIRKRPGSWFGGSINFSPLIRNGRARRTLPSAGATTKSPWDLLTHTDLSPIRVRIRRRSGIHQRSSGGGAEWCLARRRDLTTSPKRALLCHGHHHPPHPG